MDYFDLEMLWLDWVMSSCWEFEETFDKLVSWYWFSDWQDIVKQEKFADAVVIATPDRCHRVSLYICLNSILWYVGLNKHGGLIFGKMCSAVKERPKWSAYMHVKIYYDKICYSTLMRL